MREIKDYILQAMGRKVEIIFDKGNQNMLGCFVDWSSFGFTKFFDLLHIIIVTKFFII